jgi:ubiquinone/menaquinone biosynthesis C-methylase UbiE
MRRFNEVAKLLTLRKVSQNDHIIDIGCGSGTYQKALSKGIYIGCDLNSQSLKKAVKAPNAEYICADATHLPFKDNFFDIVLCSEVLEHLDSPLKAIKELARASKKMIVLTFPNEKVMERFGQKNPAHTSKIQGPWVRSALINYGYETIFHKVLYFFLPCITLDKLKIPATRNLLRLANTLSNNLSLSFLNKLALSKTYVLMLVKTDLKSLSVSSKQKHS